MKQSKYNLRMPSDFSKRLDALMRTHEPKRLTQDELAEKVGVSRQTISNWLNGGAPKKYEMILEIAKALNVSPSVLTGEPMPEEPTNDLLLAMSAYTGLSIKSLKTLHRFTEDKERHIQQAIPDIRRWKAEDEPIYENSAYANLELLNKVLEEAYIAEYATKYFERTVEQRALDNTLFSEIMQYINGLPSQMANTTLSNNLTQIEINAQVLYRYGKQQSYTNRIEELRRQHDNEPSGK